MSGSKKVVGALIKNSVIKCTIDDVQLKEGLIVVSFAHKDNLYQGVLLQLSRERGLPAGIPSFPKDHFSEENKGLSEPNPSQTPPLNQRNTYFQETDNGRQYRSLRRVIKTPARFKNSRMSLRPVHRPILCGKCAAVCTDNSNNNNNKETKDSSSLANNTVEESSNENSKKQNKNKLKLKPKVLLQKLSPASTSQSSSSQVEDGTGESGENSQDYNYEGVGSKGIVDNWWKRPLSKPLRYPTRSTNATSAKTIDVKTKSVKIIKTQSCNKLRIKMKAINSPSENASVSPCPIFRITKPKSLKSTENEKKANNLKLCITKLTMAQEAKSAKMKLPNNAKQTDNNNINSKLPKKSSKVETLMKSVPPMRMKIIPVHKTKASKIKRRNSTLPYRIRDKVAQNPPTWRTRKISTMSNPDEHKVISADELKSDVGHDEENKVFNDMSSSSYAYKLENQLSPIDSPDEFEMNETTTPTSTTLKPEPAKTPVIKLKFGSCGILQIPPRDTNHNHRDMRMKPHPPQPPVSLEEEQSAKAVRKAMKKAKKEAKRKHHHISKELPILTSQEQPMVERSPSPTKQALAPLTIHLNGSGLHTTTIEPSSCRMLVAPLAPPGISPGLSTTSDGITSSTATMEGDDDEIEQSSSKKKKKAKKRKKDHKENNSNNNGESCTSIVNAPGSAELSSPVAKSEITAKRKRSTSISPKEFLVSSETSSSGASSASLNTTSTASSTISDPPTHHRVCISLKRLHNNSNAYIPWNTSFSSGSDEHGATSDSAENEEPHEFGDDSFLSEEFSNNHVESYNHTESNHKYKKGDIIWGKSTGSPSWWPGKIIDILMNSPTDARAKISWYKSSTQSFIAFTDLHPFEEYFDTKYTKNRLRGFYQQAVRDALTEAHQLNSEDLATD